MLHVGIVFIATITPRDSPNIKRLSHKQRVMVQVSKHPQHFPGLGYANNDLQRGSSPGGDSFRLNTSATSLLDLSTLKPPTHHSCIALSLYRLQKIRKRYLYHIMVNLYKYISYSLHIPGPGPRRRIWTLHKRASALFDFAAKTILQYIGSSASPAKIQNTQTSPST